MKIEHLVLAVAGLGKRLLPLTLNTPKALVEANGKPLIDYVLDEAKGTSIREVTIVISPQHEEQFKVYCEEAKKRFPRFKFHICPQDRPLGNGHAVLQAAHIVGDQPFAVRFPDDLLFHEKSALHSMLDIYEQVNASVVLLQQVPKEEVVKYGVVDVAGEEETEGGKLYTIKGVVEKPPVDKAPSDLTIVGGYVLTPAIMKSLQELFANLSDMSNDILPLVDAFKDRIGKGDTIYGWQFPGTRFDCGSLQGFQVAEEFLRQRSGN